MPRPVTAPLANAPKFFPLRVPGELAIDLYAYCAATGASHTHVICKAVRRLIARELDVNPGVRDEFDVAKRRLLETRRGAKKDGLRLVENAEKRPRRKKPSPANSDAD